MAVVCNLQERVVTMPGRVDSSTAEASGHGIARLTIEDDDGSEIKARIVVSPEQPAKVSVNGSMEQWLVTIKPIFNMIAVDARLCITSVTIDGVTFTNIEPN